VFKDFGKLLHDKEKENLGVGGIYQWYNTCLIYVRPWVQFPSTTQKKKRKKKENNYLIVLVV
jgi:hypothetical protein